MLFKFYMYFLLLQYPLYKSYHKNATLKHFIVCLCMCIVTGKNYSGLTGGLGENIMRKGGEWWHLKRRWWERTSLTCLKYVIIWPTPSHSESFVHKGGGAWWKKKGGKESHACVHIDLLGWVRLARVPEQTSALSPGCHTDGAETGGLCPTLSRRLQNHSPLSLGTVEKAAEQHAQLVVWKINPWTKAQSANWVLAPPSALRSSCQLWLAFLTLKIPGLYKLLHSLGPPQSSSPWLWYCVMSCHSWLVRLLLPNQLLLVPRPLADLGCLCFAHPSDPPAAESPTPAVWSHCLSNQPVRQFD